MARKRLSAETMVDLKRRLEALPPRSPDRKKMIQETADLYDVSVDTLYRALREFTRPKSLRRSDWGSPRTVTRKEMERYCEIITAMKIRTSNRKGRHISTTEAIRLLEEYGVTTPDGLVKLPQGLLRPVTANRYLKKWGYQLSYLHRQPPAVRFQAQFSNQCWHFDLSPSDLKHVKKPLWCDEERGCPTLMLFSVVDDRSGVSYQEYRCVYGEEVGAALRFLFDAMNEKDDERFPFQGIPEMIYTDNGPIARSKVFRQVMGYLGVTVQTHLPQGKDGRRKTARAKGKVERPFRTVKEMQETLYHFHEPENEKEAQAWLMNFLLRYNNMGHREEPHSRFDDWTQNLPPSGIRKMCSWERFCTFAREPERRTVGGDARVPADGILYQVDPDLAGETVILWWGLFDTELYVEHEERKHGPYSPINGPVPLHKYRSFKKTQADIKADRLEELAQQLSIPREAVAGEADGPRFHEVTSIFSRPFQDPDPFEEFSFANAIDAKKAISDYLGKPLAKLSEEQLRTVASILEETLQKSEVMKRIRESFGTGK